MADKPCSEVSPPPCQSLNSDTEDNHVSKKTSLWPVLPWLQQNLHDGCLHQLWFLTSSLDKQEENSLFLGHVYLRAVGTQRKKVKASPPTYGMGWAVGRAIVHPPSAKAILWVEPDTCCTLPRDFGRLIVSKLLPDYFTQHPCPSSYLSCTF